MAPALSLIASLAACQAAPPTPPVPPDPTVWLHTEGGGELGVSTPYGVVFLGRGSRSGEVEFDVWFGDGPGTEIGIIESLGNGLYLTQAEILLPQVPLGHDLPPAGTSVVVRGRDEDGAYEPTGRVAEHERVEGLIVDLGRPSPEPGAGAGIFVQTGDGLRLIGLVAGRLEMTDPDPRPVAAGDWRRLDPVWTAIGPDKLWRLVAHARDSDRPRRAVYREDILP